VIRICLPALVLLLLAGCGAASKRPAPSEWKANAAGVAKQLRADIGEIEGIDTRPLARAALRDDSQLLVLLVAFGELGGCRHMAAALGERPPGFAATDRLLGTACARTEHAAALFMRAVTRRDPAALVAAARTARSAGSALAQVELAVLR
jgi:hypothetical protein